MSLLVGGTECLQCWLGWSVGSDRTEHPIVSKFVKSAEASNKRAILPIDEANVVRGLGVNENVSRGRPGCNSPPQMRSRLGVILATSEYGYFYLDDAT